MICRIIYNLKKSFRLSFMWSMLHLFRIFPINRNKIFATATRGRRYADNPRYIVEELLRMRPNVDIVWRQAKNCNYRVPDTLRIVRLEKKNLLRFFYELATSYIVIESALVDSWFRKRKGQIYIQTWHGGICVKKIEYDANNFIKDSLHAKDIEWSCKCADVFLSNSDFLSRLYRRAFGYKGPIFNCGFPRNDMLLGDKTESRLKVRKELGLPFDVDIVTYAPTFREYFRSNTGKWNIDLSVYNLDYERVIKALEMRFGRKCVVLVKMHPNNSNDVDLKDITNDHIIDVTKYNNMQEIIAASDYFVSDYSSGIFEAAMIGISCFTYATDFEKYKSDERGCYFEMEELPFPYAKNNDEMIKNIQNYDNAIYQEKWQQFAKEMGLNETGHAARDVAEKICDILDGEKVEWNNSEI